PGEQPGAAAGAVILDAVEHERRPVAIAEGTPRHGAELAVPIHLGIDLVKLALLFEMRDPAAQVTKLHVCVSSSFFSAAERGRASGSGLPLPLAVAVARGGGLGSGPAPQARRSWPVIERREGI